MTTTHLAPGPSARDILVTLAEILDETGVDPTHITITAAPGSPTGMATLIVGDRQDVYYIAGWDPSSVTTLDDRGTTSTQFDIDDVRYITTAPSPIASALTGAPVRPG